MRIPDFSGGVLWRGIRGLVLRSFQRCQNPKPETLQRVILSRDIGGCQNYGPFLGTLNSRGRITIGIQKGTIILYLGFGAYL